jgi:hypothetical protein
MASDPNPMRSAAAPRIARCSATTKPWRTRRANISTVKPCASMIASVAPFGASASVRRQSF